MLEGWNNNIINKPAFHMGEPDKYGTCSIESTDQTAGVAASNCDNGYQNPPFQWLRQGCVGNDNHGPWATSDGGVCK
jgi:hypothetical protein